MAIQLVPAAKVARKRSDWRTAPREEFWVRACDEDGRKVHTQDGQAIYYHSGQLQYLVAHYPRGYDYQPVEPSHAAGKIHCSGQNATFTKDFGDMIGVNANLTTQEKRHQWRKALEPRATHAEIGAAITGARRRDRLAVEVLEWRQQLGPDRDLSATAFKMKHGIKSNSTLTNRLYKAVLLVFDELDRTRNQVAI